VILPHERQSASSTTVWIVWWEEPDRSWEAICLSEAECDREYSARSNDSRLGSWGKVGRLGPQTLLAWLEGHSSNDSCAESVREVLRRAASDSSGPVIVRTW
jgi:hypothetical protein